MTRIGERDQTGLRYRGRHSDGRYRYASVSVLGAANEVLLTHDQRVGLATLKALSRLLWPNVETPVYPMTRQSSAAGYGNHGAPGVWIRRPDLEAARIWIGVDTLIHEMAHNVQTFDSKPHGREFKIRVLAAKVTKGFKVLPKLDLRKLRDSKSPAEKKREARTRRRKVAAKKTKVQEWSEKLSRATDKLAEWEGKRLAAERKVASWERRAAHAATFWKKAQEREGRSGE